MGSGKSKLCKLSNSCASEKSSYCVERAKYDNSFQSQEFYKTIHDKLQNSNQNFGVLSEKEKQEMIFALADKDTFVKKHLKLEEHYNKDLIKDLQDEMEFALRSGVNGEKEAELMIESLLDYRRRATRFDVRLFFTRIQGLNTNKTVVGVVGRIIQYGPIHVGLEISGVPLHWNTNSLVSVVPNTKPLLSYSRLYLECMRRDEYIFDKVIQESKLSTVEQAENYYQRLVQMHYDTKHAVFMKLGQIADDKLHKIAQTYVWYNKKKIYDVLRCNCQTFVRDILQILDIKFDPEDEFQLFMERIRTSHCDSSSFKYKDQIFESREPFDHYVNENWESETSQWNKRLLIQYSDLMHDMYQQSDKTDTTWGPMTPETEKVWQARLESTFE